MMMLIVRVQSFSSSSVSVSGSEVRCTVVGQFQFQFSSRYGQFRFSQFSSGRVGRSVTGRFSQLSHGSVR